MLKLGGQVGDTGWLIPEEGEKIDILIPSGRIILRSFYAKLPAI
jgi:Ser-tRNA(Ala) deacylase AlaX